jgi:Trypsin
VRVCVCACVGTEKNDEVSDCVAPRLDGTVVVSQCRHCCAGGEGHQNHRPHARGARGAGGQQQNRRRHARGGGHVSLPLRVGGARWTVLRLHVSIRCLGDHNCPRGVPVAQRPIISHTLLSFFRLLHLRRCRLLRRRRFLIYNNSLIAGDILLTTAECAFAFQPDQLVYLGGIRRDGSDADTQIVTVSRTLISPFFQSDSLSFNNIMLVKIVEDMSAITPVPLNADAAVPVDGATCIAIGYGFTTLDDISIDDLPFSDVLLQVQVPIISNDQCAEIYNLEKFYIDDLMCAGGEFDRGACAFDNGSPLLCNGKIVGLVAYDLQYFFNGCGVAGLPNVRIVKFVAGRCERNENMALMQAIVVVVVVVAFAGFCPSEHVRRGHSIRNLFADRADAAVRLRQLVRLDG